MSSNRNTTQHKTNMRPQLVCEHIHSINVCRQPQSPQKMLTGPDALLSCSPTQNIDFSQTDRHIFRCLSLAAHRIWPTVLWLPRCCQAHDKVKLSREKLSNWSTQALRIHFQSPDSRGHCNRQFPQYGRVMFPSAQDLQT